MRKSKLLTAFGNTAYTENMALSNKSTGSKLLDFYLHAAARRGQDNRQLFLDAFNEDELLTLKALFYLRDVCQGKGERDTFRDLLVALWNRNTDLFNALVPLVAEYGRWDDLVGFWANENVVRFIKTQLAQDLVSDRPSLLAKWMPSENTSSKETVELAKLWIEALEMSPRNYRKTLSIIRRKLKVVEVDMSKGNWKEINYSHVPSKANLIYRNAFSRHDPVNYTQFIKDAKAGKVKINSSVIYPHEIIYKVRYGEYDNTLEALWAQLPNYCGDKKAMVVADVSGSMMAALNKSKAQVIDVSVALAIYFADKNTGPFAGHFITFSATPELVDISSLKNLQDKVYQVLHHHSQGLNTNLQAVFDELLKSAKRHKVSQEDMPEVIFVCSDMQFDSAGGENTNFEVIEAKYKKSGYVMPKLVFWNIASRVNETPVTKDQENVFLASGFSTDTFQKVLNLDETRVPVKTPEELMLHILNGERYAPIEEAYRHYMTVLGY